MQDMKSQEKIDAVSEFNKNNPKKCVQHPNK